MTDEIWLVPRDLPPLDGDEPFAGLDATVLDFWRFAMSDLRMNNVRGYLAEFLVARALGVTGRRVEWANHDVEWDGVTIEVKASAYLQAWDQRRLSQVKFTGLTGRSWDAREGYGAVKEHRADVYVFALQGSTSHDLYDPLDVSSWRFWTLPRTTLVGLGADRLTLASVRELAEEVEFAALPASIASSAGRTSTDVARPYPLSSAYSSGGSRG